ncbi:MAG: tetratricopeptide repeat protein [Pseudomonadales bacterium]|nr:tetratricopeptide repeat protein [Pseudomonadales bacterium]
MDPQQRIESLTNFLKADPNNPSIIADLVDIYLQVGPLSSAQALLGRGIEHNPNNPRLMFQKATVCISQAEYDTAKDLLMQLLDSGIDNAGVRYNLALSLAMLSKMPEALTHLEVIRSHPESSFVQADVLYLRALHHTGELEKAIELASELAKQHTDNGDLLGVLSILYLDKQDYELARHYAEQAQSLAPNNNESLATLGTLFLDDMETKLSVPCFQKILDKQPNDGRAWLGMGLAALLDQDLDAGEDYLENATKFMPSHLGSWNALTWVRITKNDLDGAEEAVTAAMEKDRTFAENHGTLGVIQILKGEREAAEVSVKKALRLDPNCFSALFAQTLLMNPKTQQQDMQNELTALMNKPLSEDGTTIQTGLQKYATKFKLPLQ